MYNYFVQCLLYHYVFNENPFLCVCVCAVRLPYEALSAVSTLVLSVEKCLLIESNPAREFAIIKTIYYFRYREPQNEKLTHDNLDSIRRLFCDDVPQANTLPRPDITNI